MAGKSEAGIRLISWGVTRNVDVGDQYRATQQAAGKGKSWVISCPTETLGAGKIAKSRLV